MSKEEIIKHIKSYGLVRQPVNIPLNNFEYMKHSLYFFINDLFEKDKYNRSVRVYHKLNKIYPVKFLNERPDGEEYFQLRNKNNDLILEIVLYPNRMKNIYNFKKGKHICKTIYKFSRLPHQRINIGYTISDFEDEYTLGHDFKMSEIDKIFSEIEPLKNICREKLINKLI